MKTSEFEYDLPEEMVAQEPATVRDECNLLVLDRKEKTIHHTVFKNLHSFFDEGDTIVINDTSVIPARLSGTKEQTGGRVEIFLLRNLNNSSWEVLAKPSKKVTVGTKITFCGGRLKAIPLQKLDDGKWIVMFEYSGSFTRILDEAGKVPLPPYIRREARGEDKERYQTVYANKPGAVAAPTAGLHFTINLFNKLREKGIRIASLTIHTGIGTFRPIKEKNIEEHRMESEFFEIEEPACEVINGRAPGKKLIAVGTTTTRVLETVSDENGKITAQSGWTDIFIHPGYRFKTINSLITNFHPPRSTTLVLTSTFCGRELLFKGYREAIENKYRFLSYGDAMLIL